MEYSVKIEQTYLGIPIQAEQPEEILEIYCGGVKLHEFRVPVCKDEKKMKYDYYSYLDLKEYQGQELTLKGNFEHTFWDSICQSETNEWEPIKQPLIHFAAERGWINDPNGLVYKDGVYHLYFQYNPMNTQWQNMSWGHSASTDLLRFKQMDNVLYPDENGTMFSGCGLVNEKGLLDLPEGTLLFYYTAAGSANDWSKGKSFTQRIAYSTDGGKTLKKLPKETIGVIKHDSRDPKVFWHEETQAYVMVLWISGNEFAILRSENLMDWTMTDSFVLDKAWECPDLFPLDCEGEKVWVFTSADGFYYLGEFDGYKFTTDGQRKYMYATKLPYAAQSYSGVKDRVITVPWLRTLTPGKLYTGMMGIPRELKLVKCGDEKVISMVPVREYENEKRLITSFNCDGGQFSVQIQKESVVEVELNPQETEAVYVDFFGQELTTRGDVIFYKGERTHLGVKIENMHIIIDRQIVEIHANNGTVNVYYETGSDELQGNIGIRGCKGAGKIYIWQP